ncbi:MAG: histidine kinase [Phaeodactylibacter sp.]|nr:histidine kinase [Phaeodactylibacter sp.]MCB9267022.1 histidine kinase [Lewinellaceae bacterium]MCB9289307.1 histidine kinase [Lewinellaceae bacterium]
MLIQAEDGLPNHYFRGLAIDAKGFLWIGSYDGLARFDGTRIRTFFHDPEDSTSLAFNAINCLEANPQDGSVWVGTYGGLSVFNPVSGNFHSFFHNSSDSTSIRSNFIEWAYIDRQGDAWVSSGSEVLTRFEPVTHSFLHYHPKSAEPGSTGEEPAQKERILALAQGAKNDSLLWASTNFRFFNFNKYTGKFSYPPASIKEASQIFPHPDGKLYIVSREGKILVYDPGTNQILRSVQLKGGWAAHRIFPGAAEALWLSCNHGIALLNTRTFILSYPWENDARNQKKYEIDLAGREGRFWSASPAGIQVFDPATTQFRNYFLKTSGEVRPYITQKIVENPAGDHLYISIGDMKGIFRFGLRNRQWELIPMPEGFPYPTFYGKDMAFLEDGRLLILEDVGLFTLSPSGKSIVSHPLSSHLPEENTWLNFLIDKQGFLWLGGSSTGVSRMNISTGNVESLDNLFPGCNQRRFRYGFCEDSRHNIWISNCSGFGVYSYERDTFYLFPFDEGGSNANTLRRVKDFAEGPNGQLWASNELDGELGRINIGQPEKGLYEKFSVAEKTREGAIPVTKGTAPEIAALTKLAIGPEGNLWGLSPEGLAKLDPGLSSLELYNDQDGLQWLDQELKVVTANQLERLSTGELVVGFRKGLSIFDPRELQKSREMPVPYLTSFKVYNNEWAADSSLAYTQLIRLSHEQNYISFEFSSIGYTHPEKFQYQYKLDGVDQDWVKAGQRNYAAYTNVPGGAYTFLVKVANSDGLWNEEPAKIRLAIAIPWWQHPWARGGGILLLFTGAYFFYRYRLGQVRKSERLKAELDKKVANLELTALRAQMNPHFLFNCLNSIDHYIIKNETRKASEYLNSFSRLIRLILQNSRSNYVNLKDELETLNLYMEMESLRFSHRFEYKITVDPEITPREIEIPPMLIQPFVENAIWHGLMHKTGKGQVHVHLSKSDGFLRCSIQDDGIGRHKAAELKQRSRTGKKSMGMNITRDRIDTINKIYETNTRAEIIDLKDENGEGTGTRVELTIPL